MKKISDNLYDVSSHLEDKYGAPGSPTWEKAKNEAWEEYNASILRSARKEAGMTQSQLAEKVGTNKGYISKVEHGKTIPTVSSFYRMISAMGMEVRIMKSNS